jgi:uncharacterized protein (DUF1697 family)
VRLVSLLRGINLGSVRRVPMPDLRELYGSLGLLDVATHVQSGNVVFTAPSGTDPDPLAGRLSDAIADRFGHDDVDVVVRSSEQLVAIVDQEPFTSAGADPTTLHVTFLVSPAAADVLADLDAVDAAPEAVALAPAGDLYVHCPDGYGRATLNNAFLERRLGVRATTRNWRTVTTLRDLLTSS